MTSPRLHAALVALPLVALPLGLAALGCTSSPAGENDEGAVRETQQALSTCATFQRGTLGTVRDATIAATITSPGWGATSVLRAGGSYETLVSFDIGSIPAGVVIESATLKLFTTSSVSGTSLYAHALLVPWTEQSSSFPSINQQFSNEVAGVMIPTTPYTYQSMSIKPAVVQGWLDQTQPNHGLILETMVSQPPNAYKVSYFVNSEATTAAMRPALEVCYATVDHCETAPCQNGATCTSSLAGYTCTCAPGFSGTNCEVNIDDCAGSPCQNGAGCTDGVSGYTCQCAAGYTGANCETDIDECAVAPCQNGGVCSNMVNAFSCACPAGLGGTTCEVNIDECAGNPCQNGSACVDGLNGYSCTCPPGFAGTHCEIDVDNCLGNACQNGSTCVDGINAYTCTCAPGYSGPLCQTNINECAGSPCQNGGACVDGINGYVCVCAAGFSGTNCQTNINDCAPNPCLNGGNCVDGVNSYTCQCANGFTGPTCATALQACGSTPARVTGTTRASCSAHKGAGFNTSGVYSVSPGGNTFDAYCDMSTSGGGWMLVLSMLKTGSTSVATGTLTTAAECGNFAISNAKWVSVFPTFTNLLGILDTVDATVSKATLVGGSNCSPFSGTTLLNNVIAWQEDSGCTQSGLDYTLWFNRESGAAVGLYNFASYKYFGNSIPGWNCSVGSSKCYVQSTQGKMFVR